MEEIISRFPHISVNIFQELSNGSLVKSKETSKEWNYFIMTERFYYSRVIKTYTNCSDKAIQRIVKTTPAAMKISSDMNKIFKKFPKGTRQSMEFLKSWGFTPLHMAAEEGQMSICELIMDNIDDKNPATGKFYPLPDNSTYTSGCTPYHLAATNGHLSICDLIIRNTDVKNPRDFFERTPLHMAAENGHFKVFKLIFENIDFDNSWLNSESKTPFHLAAEKGHVSICELILKHVKDVNPRTSRDLTPFHLAAMNGHMAVCKLLMEYLHDKNPKTIRNETPLHFAARNGHLSICELIINNISDKNPID